MLALLPMEIRLFILDILLVIRQLIVTIPLVLDLMQEEHLMATETYS